MKQMPQIHKFMTPMPHTIDSRASVVNALGIMSEHQIRHLPVISEGLLVGILTDRDIKLASSFQGADALTVEGVMTPEPYAVVPEASLDHVVLEMAEKKYGCAVVQQDNGKIVGIFTANDGLRAFGEQMVGFYKHSPLDGEVRTHL